MAEEDKYQEKLFTQKGLNKYIKKYEKIFYRKYNQDDYLTFKLRADKFFNFCRELKLTFIEIPRRDNTFPEIFNRQIKARLFLGVGCELLLKSIYLKKGYIINSINKDKRKEFKKFIQKKNISEPYKIKEIPKRFIDSKNTFFMNYLLKHLHTIFQLKNNKRFITYIKKGFEVARVWRNKEAHSGIGYHNETNDLSSALNMSIINTYSIIFNEKVSPLIRTAYKEF